MKQTIILLAFLFTLPNLSIGQTELIQGYIKMEITDVASPDEQMAAGLEMLKGTETEYFFNKENSLVKANMMGGMMEMTSLVDNETEDLLFLMNMMGKKMAVESTKEERDAEAAVEGTKQFDPSDMNITYDESDTKKILGYNCIKATVENEDAEFGFTMYVSEEIKASNKLIQGLQDLDIRGFPLEYVMEMEQMQMTYTAIAIEEEVDTKVFDVSDEGYQKMSFSEFMEQMGSMGGGMGF